MNEFHARASTLVNATPLSAFDLITDLQRLPEWNTAVEKLLEQPAALIPGAEWVVLMHPRGLPSWRSRSCVKEIDRSLLRFTYQTHTDDGNPSFANWTWQILADSDGARVSVEWDVHPKTIGRQLLGARLRRHGLAREVPASLDALGGALRPVTNRHQDPR